MEQLKAPALGARIRVEREARGWTQQELAYRLKVGLASVYKWEKGMVVASAPNLQKLADAFDVSMAELTKLAGPAKTHPAYGKPRASNG